MSIDAPSELLVLQARATARRRNDWLASPQPCRRPDCRVLTELCGGSPPKELGLEWLEGRDVEALERLSCVEWFKWMERLECL